MLDPIAVQRTRDILRDHLNNVIRMMDGVDAGDLTHTVATLTAICNAAASALQTAVTDIDAIKAGYALRLAPRDLRTWPRVPRYRDADLPRVVSTGNL